MFSKFPFFILSIVIWFFSSEISCREVRLPITVIPSAYELTIAPDFETDTFSGQVTITGRTYKPTSIIILNSVNLNLTSFEVYGNLTAGNLYQNHTYFAEEEQVWIYLKGDEEEGEGEGLTQRGLGRETCQIKISFEGDLKDQNNSGFYKAVYVNKNGVENKIATTQFQATYARKAFPCFDEPALKATFSITIQRPHDYHAISNMPLLNENTDNTEFAVDTFETTPKMSTYLVAFVISKYGKKSEGIHEVYARDYYVDDGRTNYALSLSQQILTNLQNFALIPYSLPKIAQVAIPDDFFFFGGMENWGLVLYRESRLLVDDKLTTSIDRQKIALIIAHEYIHQWFGNLVTPQFWDYVWLSEGFAKFLEYYFAEMVEPNFGLKEQFVTSILHNALDVDANKDIRAMTFDIEDPAVINTLFDDIAYSKSASVLRMVQNFLTMDVFTEGLQTYLQAYNFDATNDDHLWSHLQKVIDAKMINFPYKLKEIMDTWVYQNNYPLISVSIVNGTKIKLTQKRFTSTLEESDRTYIIPINYATSKNPSFDDTKATHWMENVEMVLDDEDLANADWIVFNKQQTGYYRVNYDENLWKKLIKILSTSEYTKIPSVNRAQLIDDSMSLSKFGVLDYQITLELISYLSQEIDYIPLTSFVKHVKFLETMLVESPEFSSFKRFIVSLLENAYKKLQANEAKLHIEKLNEELVLTTICRFGYEDCQKKMLEKLENIENEPISADMQSTVYCSGMLLGNITHFNILIDLYKKPTTESAEKTRIINGIGCSSDKYIISLFLALIDNVLADNKVNVLTAAMSTHNGIDVVLDYLMQSLLQYLSEENAGKVLTVLSTNVVGGSLTSKTREFLAKLSDGPFASIAKTAEEKINSNIAWYNKHEPTISAWLAKKYVKGSSAAVNSSIIILSISIIISLFFK